MSFWQDVRLAARLLLKDRWYTAVAVFALGLGIGVNNTIFTFVNAVLLRGLPYPESHRILFLGSQGPADTRNEVPVSYPDFEDWRTNVRSFEGLAAFRTGTMNVGDAERPAERTAGAWMTANTFSMLGQQTLIGRGFLPGEDQPGTEQVAIIGYALWQNRYGGDPAILGRMIRVNEVPARVIGVMPRGMQFPQNADMWQPLVPERTPRRSVRDLSVFGRLADGVSLEQAREEMRGVARRLADAYPDTNKGYGAYVVTFNERFNGGPIRALFLSLMGAVALVLIIACANVANLLLARSSARAREMALRVSMGATRWRIVRQLLVESILLGCIAGAFGLAVSWVGVRMFEDAVRDVGKPYWIVFTMDATVFAFLAGVCLLTGVLFGLAPALQVSRGNTVELLKEGGRSGGQGYRASRFSSAMVVAEVALTIVLLVGAGLMVRSFANVRSTEYGFDMTRLVGAVTQLAERKYPDAASRIRFHDAVVERISAIPGIERVAVASSTPGAGGGPPPLFEIEGRPAVNREDAQRIIQIHIGDTYFDTLGVSLRRGRLFSSRDGVPGAEAAIVNERFVARFFRNEDVLGRRLRTLSGNGASDGPWMTIVGVSPTLREGSLQSLNPDPVVYAPIRQKPDAVFALVVRTAADAASSVQPIRAAVQEIDPDQPLFNLRPLTETFARLAWPWRVFGSLFVVFATIALALSAVGLYALTAYSVAQRTQEIGVRLALGAQRREVSWLILRRGLIQLGLGTVLGLVGAYFASGLLRQLLVQMSPNDPLTFVAISGLLLIVTVTACLVPARRAMRVNPIVALRAE
jgi:putative ABC transport system permease protein